VVPADIAFEVQTLCLLAGISSTRWVRCSTKVLVVQGKKDNSRKDHHFAVSKGDDCWMPYMRSFISQYSLRLLHCIQKDQTWS
jgi:hypothetical protein